MTIVEFTDYQCPFCARHAQQTQPALEAQYGSTIRYVVRNFPVPQLHPMAAKAAEAAECAYEQGGFWDYRPLLFERQRELDVSVLKALALEAGLDGAAFDECLDSGRMAPIVERDLQDGISMGVRGTPSFFVNGRPVVGAVPLSIFESAIAAVR